MSGKVFFFTVKKFRVVSFSKDECSNSCFNSFWIRISILFCFYPLHCTWPHFGTTRKIQYTLTTVHSQLTKNFHSPYLLLLIDRLHVFFASSLGSLKRNDFEFRLHLCLLMLLWGGFQLGGHWIVTSTDGRWSKSRSNGRNVVCDVCSKGLRREWTTGVTGNKQWVINSQC